ncbi:hypothetical protein Taro_022049 [Colocasia esculenta]|uniref:Uncharacterized protein n=1 Tax=Colocasia esculenta TaxID=4460 RepID=A0A843V0F4_COLES|nr:hypothetical protein [Colocasia esculenta]
MSFSLGCCVVSASVPSVTSTMCPTPLVSAGVVCVARPQLVVVALCCSVPQLSSTMLVPAALAGEGLVIPTEPCSRGSPPLLPSARGSSSRELGVRRVAEVAVAPCVVSSSESSCSRLFKFSTYLTRLILLTLPDLWIRGWRREFRAPGGGPGGRVITVGIRAKSTEICKELITIAVPKKGVWLPCKLRVRAAVGCSCCCVACVASVIARCSCCSGVVAVESLAVVFSYGGHLQASPGAVLLIVFGVLRCVRAAEAERACVLCGLHRCWVLPMELVEEVLPRSALCLFRATVVLPLWFEVFRLVGLHSGEVLPGWLLALLVEVLPKVVS